MAALVDWRPLGVLAPFVVAALGLGNPFLAVLGLGAYGWVAQRLANSRGFQDRIVAADTQAGLERLLREVEAAGANLRSEEARRVLQGARDVFALYRRQPEAGTPRFMLVEQGLKIARVYVRLARAQLLLWSAPRGAPNREAVLARNADKMRALEGALQSVRQRLLSPDAGAAGEDVEEVLLEAEALEEALEEVEKRTRVRARGGGANE